MERNYFYRRWSMSLLFLITLTLGTSCTIYQNVPDDDGIYTTENTRREPVVVVEDSDEHREYEKNYFTKELEKIDRINGTDIITDIETYSSYNDTIPDKSMDSINEPTGRAWGYNDGDNVVININLNNNWDYGWGWGGFYDPFFNSYPWFAGPRWGWGWNRPYWGWGWGWNRPFWNPYWGFNRPFWGGGFYAYNGFRIGNYNYGRRTAYNSAFNRRSSSLTRRGYSVASRRGNVSQLRNRNTSARRQSSSTNVSRRNSSSTVRRNSQTARNRSTSSRRVNNSSSSVRRNNSRSYNRPSPSRSRSYNRGASSGASRSSGGVSRGSSSRGGRRGG